MSALASTAARGHFLRQELRAFPGRWNFTLRLALCSAIVIGISMTLQVPFVFLSMFTLFLAVQSNAVVNKQVGIGMIVGLTLVVLLMVLLARYTFGNPALRIAIWLPALVVALYLQRATTAGELFYLLALVSAALQGYFDTLSSGELVLRALLYAWIAGVYPVAISLIVNTVLLPNEPLRQLKDEARRQFGQVDAVLAHAAGGPAPDAPLTLDDLRRAVLTNSKLLRLVWMRDPTLKANEARHLALATAGASLREQALRLQTAGPQGAAPEAIATVRAGCARLAASIEAESAFDLEGLDEPQGLPTYSPLDAMWHVLVAVAHHETLPPAAAAAKGGFFLPDAFTNPAYVRFALKTALATMLGYLFYSAVDWHGEVSTFAVTCIIVAQPSLGETNQKARLRVLGAGLACLLALLLVVFVEPHLDTLVGLLLMTVPVLGFAAYVQAGSERVSYMGTQLMFTFTLAMLGSTMGFDFGPSTDLTSMRDRLIGILMGVGLSYVIQTRLWPETDFKPLADRIAALLRQIAAYIALPADPDARLARSAQAEPVWQAWSDCATTLDRFSVEPGWQQGESEHEEALLRARQLTRDAREILLAAGQFGAAIDGSAAGLDADERAAITSVQQDLAERLTAHAEALERAGSVLYRPDPATVAPPPTATPAGLPSASPLARYLHRLEHAVQFLLTPAASPDPANASRVAAEAAA